MTARELFAALGTVLGIAVGCGAAARVWFEWRTYWRLTSGAGS